MNTYSALLFVLVTATLAGCFNKHMESLSWKHIESKNITDFDYKIDKAAETIEIFSADNQRFRLRVFERAISGSAYGTYVTNTFDIVRSFYKEFESPYPATYSEKIVCTDALKPRAQPMETNAELIKDALLVYANSRYTYGDCDPAELKYETLHALVHCKKADLTYEIKYFIAKSDTSTKTLQDVFKSLRCN